MRDPLDEHFHRYSPLVYRRCRTILRNEEEARDGVQEVFLQAAERPWALVGVRTPAAYFWRMATNYSLNRLAREGRWTLAEPEDGPARGPSLEDEVLARVDLERLLAQAPPRTRELAWYRWVDGMTWDEAAEAAGMSVSGVRRHLTQFSKRTQAKEKR